MKKNEIFTFTAPNGVEVPGVVIEQIGENFYEGCVCSYETFLCYAQNRIFTYFEMRYRERTILYSSDLEQPIISKVYEFGKILVDYAILPEYDEILEDYQHQLDMADDYADKTL